MYDIIPEYIIYILRIGSISKSCTCVYTSRIKTNRWLCLWKTLPVGYDPPKGSYIVLYHQYWTALVCEVVCHAAVTCHNTTHTCSLWLIVQDHCCKITRRPKVELLLLFWGYVRRRQCTTRRTHGRTNERRSLRCWTMHDYLPDYLLPGIILIGARYIYTSIYI